MKDEGGWKVPSKYEMLAKIFERTAWEQQEIDSLFYNICIGVLRDLHEADDRGPGREVISGNYAADGVVDSIWARMVSGEGIDFDERAEQVAGDDSLPPELDIPATLTTAEEAHGK